MARKKRRRHSPFVTLLLVIGFLIGVGIFLYPTLSDMWNTYRNQQLIAKYQQSVVTLTEEDYSDILKEAQEYNAQHTVNHIMDAFDEEENDYVLSHPYDGLLNPSGNEIMGYLEIPVINVELPIFHGIGKDALEQGVGHVEGTSLPIGGIGTHAVLSGHRGLPSAKIFTDLDQVKIGDLFYLIILGDTLAYEVDQILTVLPDEEAAIEAIALDPEADLVTLITCTPYAVNTHRLLVRGHRVEYIREKEAQSADKQTIMGNFDQKIRLLILGSIVFLMLLIFIIYVNRKKKKDSK